MKKYDVFISYSRKDIAFAEKVCAVFDAYKCHYNFEYFFDTEEITSKHDYLERISTAISESKVMLFLASKNSTDSEFCLKELLFADEEKVHIHQYRLDNSAYPKSIKLLLGNHHYREAKNFLIEEIVREVLSSVLDCEIKPLSEFSKREEEDEGEKPKIFKKLALAFRTIANYVKKIIRVIFIIWLIPTVLFVLVWILESVGDKVKDRKAQKLADTEGIYQPGVYYNKDGKEGVVFWVDETGKHGKIVSLDQEELQWCTDAQYNKGIVVGASSETDGKANTDKVMARADFGEYQVFVWCRNMGEDWYLPAKDELELLLQNDSVCDAVNRALKNREAAKFSKMWYWSSTEHDDFKEFCAWSVDMDDERTYYSSKNDSNYVRAVSTF